MPLLYNFMFLIILIHFKTTQNAPVEENRIDNLAMDLSSWDESHPQNPEEFGEYFEGDIITPNNGRNGIVGDKFRWENGQIPYEISDSFSTNDRKMINKAMELYKKYTCISFRPRNKSDNDYILLTNHQTGCWSSIGRKGGVQEVNLQSPQCTTKIGTPIHELMHAAGFLHEQNRHERDEFVTIHWNNIMKDSDDDIDLSIVRAGVYRTVGMPLLMAQVFIRDNMDAQRYIQEILEPHLIPYLRTLQHPTFLQDIVQPHIARQSLDDFYEAQILLLSWPPSSGGAGPTFDVGKESNFNKAEEGYAKDYGIPYDFISVMHYSSTAFSYNGQRTISPKEMDNIEKMGQRNGFSKGDITKINAMYNCPEKTQQLNITGETTNETIEGNNSAVLVERNPFWQAANSLFSIFMKKLHWK